MTFQTAPQKEKQHIRQRRENKRRKNGKGLISGAINLIQEKLQANMHKTCLCYS